MRLTISARKKAVASLHQQGLSTRKIAKALGTSPVRLTSHISHPYKGVSETRRRTAETRPVMFAQAARPRARLGARREKHRCVNNGDLSLMAADALGL